ncbi:MAG: hypothetical protein HC890_07855 [Chloroflexaceae bacterium]|nr:hypothetical protein [Chloroflexaceae bacterium]
MARDDNFPFDLASADGFVPMGNGFEARRRTGIVRVRGSAVSHPVLNLDGSALTLLAGELVTAMTFRLGHGLTLATSGVLKLALASNANATASSVGAVLRTSDTTPLAPATSFAADGAGWALITFQAPVAATAAPLALFGRDAAAAGTADVAIAPAAGAPTGDDGQPTAIVVVELFTLSRKIPIRADDPFLPKVDQARNTRVIASAAVG